MIIAKIEHNRLYWFSACLASMGFMMMMVSVVGLVLL